MTNEKRNKEKMNGTWFEESLEKRTKEKDTGEVMNMVVARKETFCKERILGCM